MNDLVMKTGRRHAFYLALVSALGRAPAFLIPVLIAAIFGSGARTDAYFLAYSAVLLFGGTLAQGVEQAVVPFAARALKRPGALHYLDRAARGCTVVGLGGWVVALPILAVLASPALRPSVASYAICLTPLTLAWCAAATFSGALIAEWRIARSTGSMLFRGAGALAGLALAPVGGGLSSVALGLGAGEICRAWWLRRSTGQGLGPDARSEPEALPGLARAASAQVGASAAIGAAPLGERLLAMSLGVGAVSHLEYAVRLLTVVSVPFDGALVPLALARWSAEVARTGPPSRRDVFKVLGEGLVVAAVIAGLLAVFAPQLVHVVLGHGQFRETDAAIVSEVLRALAAGFVPNMGASLIERHYIALTRNRLLAGLSVGRVGLRLLTAWVLLGREGLLAFPIGYAVSEWLYLFTLAALLAEAKPAPRFAR